MTEGALPDRARLVIMGAGIVGCSAAYHLARLGWRDMVVVDQGSLFETGGSTSHAPGGVFQTNFSKMMTDFARYTVELYNGLALDGEALRRRECRLAGLSSKVRFEDMPAISIRGMASPISLTIASTYSPSVGVAIVKA